jgi:hypothetical protein
MSVLEPTRIFQAETKHPIETYVREPHERQLQWQMSAGEERIPTQRQRADVGVDCIVGRCSDAGINDVADHRDIWYEKEQDEQKPTAVVRLIGDEAGNENGRTFEMEKWFGIHCWVYSSLSCDENAVVAETGSGHAGDAHRIEMRGDSMRENRAKADS